MHMAQTPYERFLMQLPTKVAAHGGERRQAVLAMLVRDFRNTCPRSSLNQFRDAVTEIRKAIDGSC